MALTKKQKDDLKREAISELNDARMTIHFSNGLLRDYRDELKGEASEMTKVINKGKAKMKKIEVKILENGGRLWKLER